MMRLPLLAAVAITTVTTVATVEIRDANAVVYCAAGVYRAGCVARPGVGYYGGGYRYGYAAPVVGARGVARRTTRRVVRRSDVVLKHDIALIGHLQNGLGFYRFSYNGTDKVYVGVMAQEVQTVMPEAVQRYSDGYLRVDYDRLGLKFQTYDQWVASGARIPAGAPVQH